MLKFFVLLNELFNDYFPVTLLLKHFEGYSYLVNTTMR